MVATELQSPDLIEQTQANTVSSGSRDTGSVSMSKESPDTDVMRLRVSIGGTFAQVRDLNSAYFRQLNGLCTLLLSSSALFIVLT